ncbi:MAG: sulfatase-like hydrolase/transferase [Pirellulales bacterium]
MRFAKLCTGLTVNVILLACLTIQAADRPNILWITSEDNGISWVGCYGGRNARTPNIDQLASEGFRYTHCFDNAAVCAPTRSTWITGHYAISLGTQPMRSRYAIPHDRVPYYPDLLKAAGYQAFNGGKTDYNIGSRDDKDCWLVDGKIPKQQPGRKLFQIRNIGDSHESNAFPQKRGVNVKVKTDPAKMILHSYHPDLPAMRLTYATYVDGVERMDAKIGQVLADLKKDGLEEDTIVVYCSDHGGVLPRSKRFLYSSGIHCPLIVRIPEKWKHWWPAEKPGMTVDRIVSFVDMPKTFLSLARAEVPDSYQGQIFLGDGIEEAPKYHLSFRERADECSDNVRGMRDHRYAYIKNYMSWTPNGQRLNYMWTMAGTRAWEQHYLAGKCNDITGRFFQPRSSEEFYDTEADFDNINNLVDDPQHQAKIAELKSAMRKKQLELFDSGMLPEGMRVRRAKANHITIYEMVRDRKLYPLGEYLDLSDMALTRDPANLNQLVASMKDHDEGIRYWAICGLFLLEDKAEPAIATIDQALDDDCPEVQMMAAWAMERLGHEAKAATTFEKVKRKPEHDKPLLSSIYRWKDARYPGDQNTWITNWKILGPFQNGDWNKHNRFEEALAPESDGKWAVLKKGVMPEEIDVEQQLGKLDNCSAFDQTTLVSTIDQEVVIKAACDDWVSVIVNGEFVAHGRSVTSTIKLKKGENQLLMKLIEKGGGWKFHCRITKNRRAVEGLSQVAK